MTSSILFLSKLYPFEQNTINTMINIARIINNKKNPVFDLILSGELNTLHAVISKFVEVRVLELPEFSNISFLLIFIFLKSDEASLASQEHFPYFILEL